MKITRILVHTGDTISEYTVDGFAHHLLAGDKLSRIHKEDGNRKIVHIRYRTVYPNGICVEFNDGKFRTILLDKIIWVEETDPFIDDPIIEPDGIFG